MRPFRRARAVNVPLLHGTIAASRHKNSTTIGSFAERDGTHPDDVVMGQVRRPIFGAEDTASDAPNGLDRPYRAAASLQRLWAVQTIAHSAWTLARPRIRNWRKPRACLIWPKTGSTMTLRR